MGKPVSQLAIDVGFVVVWKPGQQGELLKNALGELISGQF